MTKLKMNEIYVSRIRDSATCYCGVLLESYKKCGDAEEERCIK